jgi:hypothetical protein
MVNKVFFIWNVNGFWLGEGTQNSNLLISQSVSCSILFFKKMPKITKKNNSNGKRSPYAKRPSYGKRIIDGPQALMSLTRRLELANWNRAVRKGSATFGIYVNPGNKQGVKKNVKPESYGWCDDMQLFRCPLLYNGDIEEIEFDFHDLDEKKFIIRLCFKDDYDNFKEFVCVNPGIPKFKKCFKVSKQGSEYIFHFKNGWQITNGGMFIRPDGSLVHFQLAPCKDSPTDESSDASDESSDSEECECDDVCDSE